MSDESFSEPRADRDPTPEEERAAERAAEGVDVDAVAGSYEHMTDLGAHIEGEGEIEPRRDAGA